MRLSLHCSGGFTGPAGAQTRSVDVDRLPAAKADHLRALVSAIDFAQPPAALMKARPQPWDFTYTLTVDDGASRQLRFHGDAAPAPLKELTDTLEQYPPA
jgi:hypothetical protein